MLNLSVEFNGQVYNPDNPNWVEDFYNFVTEGAYLTSEEMDELARRAVSGIKTNIRTATDIFGNAMLPLMPSTIRKKGNAKILVDTGQMMESIDWQGTGVQEREIYSDSSYGAYHQTGTRNMVARPWFGISPSTDEILTQYLRLIGYGVAA